MELSETNYTADSKGKIEKIKIKEGDSRCQNSIKNYMGVSVKNDAKNYDISPENDRETQIIPQLISSGPGGYDLPFCQILLFARMKNYTEVLSCEVFSWIF